MDLSRISKRIVRRKGVHYYDGFIKNFKKDSAKEIIDKFLQRLNNGEDIPPSEISKALDEFIPK